MSPDGIRVDLRIEDPGACPVADATDRAEARARNVSRAVRDGERIVEFTVTSDAETLANDLETVFESDAVTRVRHCGATGEECACRVLAEFGVPASDATAENGVLTCSFYTADVETLEAVVERFRSQFASVHVTDLAGDHEFDDRDLVSVDRARLTDRQREVLETALSMGYFETPKRANAGDVADELDIALPTVCEHLSSGQGKLLAMAFGAERKAR